MRKHTVLLPVLLALLAGAEPALAWTWPADGPVLQSFSYHGDPYGGGQHRGIDIAASPPSSIVAPYDGIVTFAGAVPRGGRTVTITTAEGLALTLLGLGSLLVAKGDSVLEGDPVATAAATATSELPQPHVHFGIRRVSDPAGYLDPRAFLPPRNGEASSPSLLSEERSDEGSEGGSVEHEEWSGEVDDVLPAGQPGSPEAPATGVSMQPDALSSGQPSRAAAPGSSAPPPAPPPPPEPLAVPLSGAVVGQAAEQAEGAVPQTRRQQPVRPAASEASGRSERASRSSSVGIGLEPSAEARHPHRSAKAVSPRQGGRKRGLRLPASSFVALPPDLGRERDVSLATKLLAGERGEAKDPVAGQGRLPVDVLVLLGLGAALGAALLFRPPAESGVLVGRGARPTGAGPGVEAPESQEDPIEHRRPALLPPPSIVAPRLGRRARVRGERSCRSHPRSPDRWRHEPRHAPGHARRGGSAGGAASTATGSARGRPYDSPG
jgi:hypothetical protein